MGKLHVHIEHGHDNGAGPWIALAVLVALAGAGGVAKAAVHALKVVAEIALYTVAGVVAVAAGIGVALAVRRVRRARAARSAPRVLARAQDRCLSGVAGPQAIDPPRARLDAAWMRQGARDAARRPAGRKDR